MLLSTPAKPPLQPASINDSVQAQARTRIWFLDFLRASAAAAVVFTHLGLLFWVQNHLAPSLWFANPISGLHIPRYAIAITRFMDTCHMDLSQCAVAVFFLVSGFVIPLTLSSGSIRRFAVARVLRLYPTYAVALTITTIVVSLSAHCNHLVFPFHFKQFCMNLSLFRDCFWTASIDGVNWTLEIEIKFYILCALMHHFSQLRPAAMVCVSLVLLAITAVGCIAYPILLSTNSHWFPAAAVATLDASRLTFILIGTCFYQLWRERWSPATFLCTAGTLFIIYAVTAATAQTVWSLEANSLRSYGLAAAIFAAVYLVRNCLQQSAAIQFAADISYPLYLIHGMTGYVLLTCLYRYLPNCYLDLALALPVIVAVAWIIHVCVEAPSIRFARRITCLLQRDTVASRHQP
jgi:peptidoglycan/LPS O-acetylase OafA/YrhL